MIYFCNRKNRRTRVLASPLNGIDYLEVGHTGTTLTLVMLKPSPSLTVSQIRISGGETVVGIVVSGVAAVMAEPLALSVTFSASGDFSSYTFSLVAVPGSAAPPAGIDPALSSVVFVFHPSQDGSVDCQAAPCCPLTTQEAPDINYLAKDFPGFRQAMLDRMAVLVPDWTESHAADVGVTLIEILAYAADHLSYRQDAVATEAYLGIWQRLRAENCGILGGRDIAFLKHYAATAIGVVAQRSACARGRPGAAQRAGRAVAADGVPGLSRQPPALAAPRRVRAVFVGIMARSNRSGGSSKGGFHPPHRRRQALARGGVPADREGAARLAGVLGAQRGSTRLTGLGLLPILQGIA